MRSGVVVTHEGNPLRVVQDKAAFMDMIATSRHWFDLSLVQELSERTKAATAGKGGSGGGKSTPHTTSNTGSNMGSNMGGGKYKAVGYPHVTWDLLPRSGARTLRPHLNVFLGRHGYAPKWRTFTVLCPPFSSLRVLPVGPNLKCACTNHILYTPPFNPF